MTNRYFDMWYKFPVAGLATALGGFNAINALIGVGANILPGNTLGDPMDNNGNISNTPTWYGRQGIAATSYIDPNTLQTVQVAAKGDPTMYYVQIRAWVGPAPILFNGTPYGWVLCSKAEAEPVLGIWLGDTP